MTPSPSSIALVTGGSGFIGTALVRALLAQGMAVRVLDPSPPLDIPSGLDWRQASVTDRAALAEASRDARWVFHLAACSHLWMPDPAVYRRVNTDGTAMVLEAAHAAGAEAIVHVSTEVILRGWNDASDTPVRESDPLPPFEALAGPYSRSKAAAERHARKAAASGAPVRIVYPTVPIGPGDRFMTPPSRMLHQLLTRPPAAYLPCLFNLVPVAAAAEGIRLAAEIGEPGGRYLLGGDHWRYDEIARHLAPRAVKAPPRHAIPYWLAAAFARAETAVAGVTKKPPQAPIEGLRLAKHPTRIDNSHARQALGWSPGDTAAALDAAADWLLAPPDSPSR